MAFKLLVKMSKVLRAVFVSISASKIGSFLPLIHHQDGHKVNLDIIVANNVHSDTFQGYTTPLRSISCPFLASFLKENDDQKN